MNYTTFLTSILLFTMSNTCFAAFCPTNFNNIQNGDSIEDVIKQCGKPSSEKTQTVRETPAQEWTYFINQQTAAQASLRLIINIDKDKVNNIQLGPGNVTNTAVCGTTIQIGDTAKAVEGACGKPNFVSVSAGTNPQENANFGGTKVTELTYSNAATTVTLTFENGVLKLN
jgi:hypothetical protein